MTRCPAGLVFTLTTAIVVFVVSGTTGAAAATCEGLKSLSLPQMTITLAESVNGGTFTPPENSAGGPPIRAIANLPAFCRVAATLKPSPDSNIQIEVWLPAADGAERSALHKWNGKLQSVGNGAWAAVIPYPALGAALAAGYATAGTDTGHIGNNARVYHGWSDQLVAPVNTINYYNRVLETTGRGKTAESVRLFMMPGMTHCAGGEGPNTFDKVAVMEQWVEHGQAPARIVACHSADGRSIAPGRCARTRGSRPTKGRAASTTRRASCAGRHNGRPEDLNYLSTNRQASIHFC